MQLQERQPKRMALTIARLVVEIGTKLNDFEKGLSTVQDRIRKVSNEVLSAGIALTAAVTGPFALITSSVVKFSGEFDKAMAQAIAIMGDVSDTMRSDLENTAKRLATETTFSAKEVAEAYFFMTSAGLKASEVLNDIGIVTRFATAGQFNLSEATRLLVDAQTALGLRSADAAKNLENLTRVSDVLVKANILANATVQEFSESLTNRAAGALRLVNKEIEEGVAVLATYAEQGIKAEEAGTRLDIMLRDLQTRAIKNKELFEQNGIAVFDAGGNMRNVADIIQDLERAFSGLNVEQRRNLLLTLEFQDRSVSALLTLVGFSHRIREFEAQLRSASGITEEVSSKQLKNLADQLTITKNSFVNVVIELGQSFIPAMMSVIEVLRIGIVMFSGLVNILSGMPEPLKEIVLFTSLFFAALGPGLLLIGGLGKALEGIITLVRTAQSLKILAFVQAHPVLLAATAVAFLVTQIALYTAGTKGATGETQGFASALEEAAHQVAVAEENLRKLNATRTLLTEKIPQLEAEILRLRGEIENLDITSKSWESRWTQLTAALQRSILSLSNAKLELASLNQEQTEAAVTAARVAEAEERFNRAIEVAHKDYQLTKNELKLVNEQVAAYEALKRSLLPLLSTEDERLQTAQQTLDILTQRQLALNSAVAEGSAKLAGTNKVYEEWQRQMQAVAIESGVFNDRQRTLRDELSLTEQAIGRWIDAAMEAGRSMDSIFTDEQFLGLRSKFDGIKQALEMQEQLDANTLSFQKWKEGLQLTLQDLQVGLMNLTNTFTTGLGQAIANIVVFQENVQDQLQLLIKRVIASVIASFVTLLAEQLIFNLIGKKLTTTRVVSEISSASAVAAAWAAAWAIAKGGLIGLIAAAGIAAAAAGIVVASAAIGGAIGQGAGTAVSAAQGIIATKPTLAMIGDIGGGKPEGVFPLDYLQNMLDMHGGGQVQHTAVYLDGRKIAESTTRRTTAVLRMRGVIS